MKPKKNLKKNQSLLSRMLETEEELERRDEEEAYEEMIQMGFPMYPCLPLLPSPEEREIFSNIQRG